MYVEGRHIIRGAGDSQVQGERFYTCPWAQVRDVQALVDAQRRVRGETVSLAEYVGGAPSTAAYEGVETADVEVGLARAVLAKEATS